LGSFNLKEGKNMATPLTNSIGSRCWKPHKLYVDEKFENPFHIQTLYMLMFYSKCKLAFVYIILFEKLQWKSLHKPPILAHLCHFCRIFIFISNYTLMQIKEKNLDLILKCYVTMFILVFNNKHWLKYATLFYFIWRND
jgi:hypothetical protein